MKKVSGMWQSAKFSLGFCKRTELFLRIYGCLLCAKYCITKHISVNHFIGFGIVPRAQKKKTNALQAGPPR
jgi:organic radical activating enzyme